MYTGGVMELLQSALPDTGGAPSLRAFLEAAAARAGPVIALGAEGACAALLLRDIGAARREPLLAVLPTEREAAGFAADLQALGADARLFPWWGTVPYRELAPRSPVFGRRARLLGEFAAWQGGAAEPGGAKDAPPPPAKQPACAKAAPRRSAGQASLFEEAAPVARAAPVGKAAPSAQAAPVMVTSQRAFLSPAPPPPYARENRALLRRGDAPDTAAFAAALAGWGWSRVGRVQLPGEFALRGEVLDLLPPGEEFAYRVLFDFSTVESIRQFDPEDQSGRREVETLGIYPLKEVLWTDERVRVLKERLSSFPEYPQAAIGRVVETLGAGVYLPGEEELFPLAFEKPASLADYVPGPGRVFFIDRERLDNAGDALEREADNLYRRAREERPAPAPGRVFFGWAALSSGCESAVSFRKLPPSAHEGSGGLYPLRCEPARSYSGHLNALKDDIAGELARGREVVVAAQTPAQRERLVSILHIQENNIQKSNTQETATREGDPRPRVVTLPLAEGFGLPELSFLLITENDIFGRAERRPRGHIPARGVSIDTFVELNPGDYVVHINYGIGRFLGIERIRTLGNERDYIKLLYADEEVVFVPIEQMNLVQRYIGSHDTAARLDALGSKTWAARKERARKAADELAGQLIALYSKRKASAGFAHPPDTEWQAMFEANFPWEETPDQLRCIAEIKADMESPYPMDRLVCGDVGYGKTEVALRACFKAVMGGKQVAFLVPTTILAEQHYQTCRERFARFPVTIGLLSRFTPAKEARETARKTREGGVDILIGTHRVIQKDIAFKNLGLMVVDEEQRFGVGQKERLKEMKHNVDCLALSATPIPRTLHISLLKIRDMSVLATAPRNRHPIETAIEEMNDERVVKAIREEAARGGQVFYLHNRVETLDRTCLRLRRLLPEILFETAHGQMGSGDLEDVMRRFIHGGFHVLVSTTIIENGIDIPNVNTIIIDRADMYGVSQLYQLRGRVGRSDRVAYAYLFYPKDRSISEAAMKRLQAISDYTELGAGFKIAMKDMEIRGAGNLLGREQSGSIYSVGFDMYMRLLDEAIARLQNEHYRAETETLLELEYSGYIPDSYIPGAQEKMEVYKKIAAVKTMDELLAARLEITDRFGPPPPEAASLLALAEIRVACSALSVRRLKEKAGVARVTFDGPDGVNVEALVRLVAESKGAVQLDPGAPGEIILRTGAAGLEEKARFIREKLAALASR